MLTSQQEVLQTRHPSWFLREGFVMEDLPQVQGDIKLLSQSCLLGKILGEPLDFKIIIAKTRADWKNIIKGNVEYISLGNILFG